MNVKKIGSTISLCFQKKESNYKFFKCSFYVCVNYVIFQQYFRDQAKLKYFLAIAFFQLKFEIKTLIIKLFWSIYMGGVTSFNGVAKKFHLSGFKDLLATPTLTKRSAVYLYFQVSLKLDSIRYIKAIFIPAVFSLLARLYFILTTCLKCHNLI